MSDYLCLCPRCQDREILCGDRACWACLQQDAIDNDPGPIICEECKSSLLVQKDWRVPILECTMCGNVQVDPNGKYYEGGE